MMNIAIWGIGDVGQYVFQQLKNNEKLNIKYFVDSNSEYWETVKNGIKVISPIQLKNVFSDEVDFLVIAFIICSLSLRSILTLTCLTLTTFITYTFSC